MDQRCKVYFGGPCDPDGETVTDRPRMIIAYIWDEPNKSYRLVAYTPATQAEIDGATSR